MSANSKKGEHEQNKIKINKRNNDQNEHKYNDDYKSTMDETPGESTDNVTDTDLIQFIEENDLSDMLDQLISSKLKLVHFKEVNVSDLSELCRDLELSSSQKIRLKHSIKLLQKKIKKPKQKDDNNNMNDDSILIPKDIDIRQIRSKLVIVGQAAVGKTTLQKSIMGWSFEPGSKATFAVNSMHKKSKYKYKNLEINVDYEIFDTPGLDRFADVITLYLRGALAVIVVYDIMNNESFNKAKWWIKYLEDNVSGYDKIILIANKIDINSNLDNINKGRLYATEKGLSFLEVSAKNNENINVLLGWLNKQSKNKLINSPQILQKNIKLHESKKSSIPKISFNRCCLVI